MKLERSNRKIHLDFHTPHWVKAVGQHYDPEQIVRIWKEAHVNAVTVVFGLCACGNAYYESDVAPVHPGLTKDMLTPLLPVAKREGIEIYVHFAPGINDRAVIEHPEWAMVTRDGTPLLADDGWGWVCFNSPWVEQMFLPQMEDFVPRFPDVAGVYLDMVTFPENTCHCEFCRSAAAELGFDMQTGEGLARLWRTSVDRFLSKVRAVVKKHNPEMGFTCNCLWFIGGPRPELQDWIELEAPVSWNSYHFAVMARYIRNLPLLSNAQTTRFPKNWGYFGSLNNDIQLKYESASVLATLGANGIGDQLPADGIPEKGVYELIGSAFAFVKEREQWALYAKSVPYIAVLADDQHMVKGAMADFFGHQRPEALYGAGLTLLEGNRHFDVIDERSDFFSYKLIWLPENKSLSAAAAAKIRAYVEGGGKLLVTGSGLWNRAEWRVLLEEMADVAYDGLGSATGDFIEPLPVAAHRMPRAPIKINGGFVKLRTGQRADVVAKAYLPYEAIDRRYGHFHAPAGEEAAYPGAVAARFGNGAITIAAASLAEHYFVIGSRHSRQLTLNFIDHMLPREERLIELLAETPNIELSLMRKANEWIVHLLQYSAKKYTENTVIEEIPQRYDIPVVLRSPHKPKRMYLAPSCTELAWEWRDDAAHVTIPELHIHQMLVLEL